MNADPYDFTKPGRLTSEWHQTLSDWFRLAFALANKTWAKQLPFAVEASVQELDVCYGQQMLAKLPEGVVAYVVSASEKGLPTLLTLPRLTLHKLIGAMLGDSESTSTDREMTLIEENLADYFLVQYWLPAFRETWPGEKQVKWTLQPRETNPQNTRVFAGNDVLIEMNWCLHSPWGDSNGTWFFQKKGLLESLGAAPEGPLESIADPVVAAQRQALVGALPVVVEVVVGTAELKLSQLTRLQVGDVVLLDQRSEDGIVARTGGCNLFRGQPGRLGSSKAFQVKALGEK